MSKKIVGSIELDRIYQIDCVEGMKLLPDDSVNLIVIDPPYNIGKDKRWDKWDTVDAYVSFMSEVFKECERVLKPNGSFYWFHNDMTQIRRLMDAIDTNTSFVYKNFIIWNKRYNGSPRKFYFDNVIKTSANRSYRPLTEYCLFYTLQKEEHFNEATKKDNYTDLIDKLLKDIKSTGLSREEVVQLFLQEGRYSTEESARVHASYKMGWGNGNRFDLMDEKLFDYLGNHINWSFNYTFLSESYEKVRKECERKRYVYNTQKTHHDVWEYEVAPKQGHITPKPVGMIENIIRHSSNEGDIVLDCFIGSGTTAVAATRLNRHFIGFERESEYIEIANKRIDNEGEIE
ncbi:site-specific DNA-methyltransferase [Listeria monocytogenes]|nr:site-specific DNA-methyltransferase [Listeria monocytogenes]